MVALLGGRRALAALAATALGSGQTVKAGNLVVFVDGGFSPQKLPRNDAGADLPPRRNDAENRGRDPSAGGENALTLEFDKHAGHQHDRAADLQRRPPPEHPHHPGRKRSAARPSSATGEAGAEIAFPEQPPFFAKGKMLIFNGRPKGGHKVLIFHVYARVPAPTTFVTTAVITKASGIYGTQTEITIPTIVAGQGSLTFAKLEIKKDWTYKGKKEHLLLATCPTGRFFTRGDLKFADGTEMKGKVLRSCSPIG